MRSSRKILWAVLEKSRLPTDILTYCQWWNDRTPFPLKAKLKLLPDVLYIKQGIQMKLEIKYLLKAMYLCRLLKIWVKILVKL